MTYLNVYYDIPLKSYDRSYVKKMNVTGNKIRQMYNELCDLYPHESFGSRSSVFIRAWKDHVITREEFEAAREYYGSLWNYCGD